MKRKALIVAMIIGAFTFVTCSSEPAVTTGSRAEFPVVFFTSDISAQGLLDIFNAAMMYEGSPVNLASISSMNVGINIHGGEQPQPQRAFAPEPALIAYLVNFVQGTLVETNVSYALPFGPGRTVTASHIEIMEAFFNIGTGAGQNNWPVAIVDADGYREIPVNAGRRLNRLYVGYDILDFDFYINLNHFTGHRQAGFGAALKNMSLGLASGGIDLVGGRGKALIHSGGRTALLPWNTQVVGESVPHPTALFQEAIAEGALSVQDYLADNNIRMLHITILNNLSLDCDCVPIFQTQSSPDINCIGIIASWDPVAVDQAAIDLIWRRNVTHLRADLVNPPGDARWDVSTVNVPADPATVQEALARGARAEGQGIDLIQRIEGMNGQWKLEWGQAIGLGSVVYRLENIDS